jgi:MraZ protein
MFWGEYSHQLDKKGRLIVPVRFRPQLATGAILTRGLDHNLAIYPQPVWEQISAQLNQMPITQASGRALRRLLFSGAVELALDKQGRLLVPGYLREYASLNRAVLVVGMETFIELWDPTEWQNTLNNVSSALDESQLAFKLNL